MADSQDNINLPADAVESLLRPATNVTEKRENKEEDPFFKALEKHLGALAADMHAMVAESKRQGDQVVALFEEIRAGRKEKAKAPPTVREAGINPAVLEQAVGKAQESLKVNAGTDEAEQSASPGRRRGGKGSAMDELRMATKALEAVTKLHKQGGKVTGVGLPDEGAAKALDQATEVLKKVDESLKNREGKSDSGAEEKKAKKHRQMQDQPKRFNPDREEWSNMVTELGIIGKNYHFFESEFLQSRAHANPVEGALENYERKRAKNKYFNKQADEQEQNKDFKGAALSRRLGGSSKLNAAALVADVGSIFADLAKQLAAAAPQWIKVGLTDDVWRQEMKALTYSTEGLSGAQQEAQRAFLGWYDVLDTTKLLTGGDMAQGANATGKTLEEFRMVFQKNTKDGYKSRLETLKMTRTALSLSTMIGSNMESTADFFHEMHLQMNMSSFSLAAMSISMQQISRESKLFGDSLLAAVQASKEMLKELRGRGGQTVGKTDAITKLIAAFEKEGIGRGGAETLKAIQGIKNFQTADVKTQAWVSMGIGKDAELNRAVQNDSLAGDKELMGRFGDNLMNSMNTLVSGAIGKQGMVDAGLRDKDGKDLRAFTAADADKLTDNQRMKLGSATDSMGKPLMEAIAEIDVFRKNAESLNTKIKQRVLDEMKLGTAPELIKQKTDNMRQEERIKGASGVGEMLQGMNPGQTLQDALKAYKGKAKGKDLVQSLKELGYAGLETDAGIEKALKDSMVEATKAAGGDVAQMEKALAPGAKKEELEAALSATTMKDEARKKDEIKATDTAAAAKDKIQQVANVAQDQALNVQDRVVNAVNPDVMAWGMGITGVVQAILAMLGVISAGVSSIATTMLIAKAKGWRSPEAREARAANKAAKSAAKGGAAGAAATVAGAAADAPDVLGGASTPDTYDLDVPHGQEDKATKAGKAAAKGKAPKKSWGSRAKGFFGRRGKGLLGAAAAGGSAVLGSGLLDGAGEDPAEAAADAAAEAAQEAAQSAAEKVAEKSAAKATAKAAASAEKSAAKAAAQAAGAGKVGMAAKAGGALKGAGSGLAAGARGLGAGVKGVGKGIGAAAKGARNLMRMGPKVPGGGMGAGLALFSGAMAASDSDNWKKTYGKEDLSNAEQGAASGANFAAAAAGAIGPGLLDGVKDVGTLIAEQFGVQIPESFKSFSFTEALGFGPGGPVTKAFAGILEPFAHVGNFLGEKLGGGLIGAFTGENARGAKLDEEHKAAAAKEAAAGTLLAHNDPKNAKKDYWAKEKAREESVATGLTSMEGTIATGDAAAFNTQAAVTTQQAMEQQTRYGASGRDDWTAALQQIQAAQDKGITLSPEVLKMFQELTKRNEIDWLKATSRDEMTRGGEMIGKNGMTKEMWEQRVTADATKKYEQKTATIMPPTIPKAAEGGLVTEGGLAIVGEDGPEWILPTEHFGAQVEPMEPGATLASLFPSETAMAPLPSPEVSAAPLSSVHDQIEQSYLPGEAASTTLDAPELGDISSGVSTTNDKLGQLVALFKSLTGGTAPSGPAKRPQTRSRVKPPSAPNYYQLAFGVRESPTKGVS